MMVHDAHLHGWVLVVPARWAGGDREESRVQQSRFLQTLRGPFLGFMGNRGVERVWEGDGELQVVGRSRSCGRWRSILAPKVSSSKDG